MRHKNRQVSACHINTAKTGQKKTKIYENLTQHHRQKRPHATSIRTNYQPFLNHINMSMILPLKKSQQYFNIISVFGLDSPLGLFPPGMDPGKLYNPLMDMPDPRGLPPHPHGPFLKKKSKSKYTEGIFLLYTDPSLILTTVFLQFRAISCSMNERYLQNCRKQFSK